MGCDEITDKFLVIIECSPNCIYIINVVVLNAVKWT